MGVRNVAASTHSCITYIVLLLDFESEGHDRSDMKLPRTSDKLAEAVIEANKSTVGKFCK